MRGKNEGGKINKRRYRKEECRNGQKFMDGNAWKVFREEEKMQEKMRERERKGKQKKMV